MTTELLVCIDSVHEQQLLYRVMTSVFIYTTIPVCGGESSEPALVALPTLSGLSNDALLCAEPLHGAIHRPHLELTRQVSNTIVQQPQCKHSDLCAL